MGVSALRFSAWLELSHATLILYASWLCMAVGTTVLLPQPPSWLQTASVCALQIAFQPTFLKPPTP